MRARHEEYNYVQNTCPETCRLFDPGDQLETQFEARSSTIRIEAFDHSSEQENDIQTATPRGEVGTGFCIGDQDAGVDSGFHEYRGQPPEQDRSHRGPHDGESFVRPHARLFEIGPRPCQRWVDASDVEFVSRAIDSDPSFDQTDLEVGTRSVSHRGLRHRSAPKQQRRICRQLRTDASRRLGIQLGDGLLQPERCPRVSLALSVILSLRSVVLCGGWSDLAQSALFDCRKGRKQQGQHHGPTVQPALLRAASGSEKRDVELVFPRVAQHTPLSRFQVSTESAGSLSLG